MTRPANRDLIPLLFAVIVGVCACCLGTLQADPGNVAEKPRKDEPRIQFRRVFVPADSPNEWPRGSTPYVPIPKDEFERLVRRANQTRSVSDDIKKPRIDRATYYGRYDSGRLVGTAQLVIKRQKDGGDLLDLSRCKTSIRDARWEGDKRRRALLGSDARGVTWLRVEQNGRLHFDWSQHQSSTSDESSRFEFAWPGSLATTMVIDLPMRKQLECEQAMVRVERGKKASASTLPALSSGYRRWRVELGSQRAGELIITEKNDPTQSTAPRVSQHDQYQISPQGLLLVANLRLDTRRPLNQITLQLDPGLEPIYVRQDGQDIRWSRRTAKSGASTLTIELPKSIVGGNHEFVIGAIGSVQTGVRWQLPAIKASDVSWRQGRASISVTSPLAAKKVTPHDGQLTSPVSDGTIDVRMHSPKARVDLIVARPSHRIRAIVGTAVNLTKRELAARANMLLKIERSDAFEITARVSPGWTIDSIEAPDEPERVVDWSFAGRREDGMIRIALSKPVPVDDQLRLVVTGHKDWPTGRTRLLARDLEMIVPERSVKSEEFMLIRASSRFQLELDGEDRLTPLDPDASDVERAKLFENPDSGFLFRYDNNADFLGVSLGNRAPSYEADTEVDVVASGQWLTETFRVSIRPMAMGLSPIERLDVKISPASQESIEWSMGVLSDSPLSAERSSIATNGDDSATAVESWQIALAQPQNQPFEIVGRRIREITPKMSVSLLSVVGATAQSGAVNVRSRDRAFGFFNRGLEPRSEIEHANASEPGISRSFRYDPRTHVAGRVEPPLALDLVEDATQPALAWVESLDATARFAAPDRVMYSAEFVIKNHSRESVLIACPAGSEIHSARVNGRDITRTAPYSSSGAADERSIEIELPSTEKAVRVWVDYSLTLRSTNLWDRWAPKIAPLYPEIDLPVLERRWSVWLPPEYHVMHRGQVGPIGGIEPPSIAQRLFGPLARSGHQSAFDPFDADSWSSLPLGKARLGRDDALELIEVFERDLAFDRSKTWGDLAIEWSAGLRADESTSPVQLWFDASALSRAGIRADTALGTMNQDGESRGDGLSELLEQRGVCVLFCREHVVITTSRRLSWFRGQFSRYDQLPFFTTTASPLGDAVERAALKPRGSWLVSAQSWANGQNTTHAHGMSHGNLDVGEGFATRWQLVRPVLGTDAQAASLRVISIDRVSRWAWLALLVAAALAWWKAIALPRTTVVGVAAIGVCAILLPMGVAPVATAGFCGALAGIAFRVVPHLARRAVTALPPSTDRPPAPDTPSFSQSAASAIVPTIVFVTLLTLLARSLVADEPIDSTKPLDRVLIPIDRNERPTGKYYYVPRSLYEQLHKIEQKDGRDAPVRWLMRSATYRINLQRNPIPERIDSSRVSAEFVIDATRGDASVTLPLSRADVELIEGSTLVNDRPLRTSWSADGTALTFNLEEAGRHRVQFEIQSKREAESSAKGLKIDVPRVANT
ncbi:MAG: hypothetical protein MI757_06125, partial [Pirellulales bacterium]|nr:hypothetical protein [Pirellulales bacterium]